jgi:hypothetical protein
VDKITIAEFLVAGCFGSACFWAPGSTTGTVFFARLAQLSFRLDGLRRSRWQWLTVVATMLTLRVQRQLPAAVELTVGFMFLVLLAFPVRQLIRARK